MLISGYTQMTCLQDKKKAEFGKVLVIIERVKEQTKKFFSPLLLSNHFNKNEWANNE